ncbi:prokaryotic diacylglycerol kinase [Bordetella bronchiseptica 99-R-0433]|nr:prokaryotic diacylglycerol kinase [Bordetella bronchiseptica 99-R-0433]
MGGIRSPGSRGQHISVKNAASPPWTPHTPNMAHTPHPSPFKSTGGLRRILNALRYSLQGLKAAIKYEAAFRQELVLAILLVPAAFFLGRTTDEVFILIASVILVLVAELLNSAIEALADALSVETHPLLGRAKDLGSAAVMLMLLFTLAVWVAVLISRFVLD